MAVARIVTFDDVSAERLAEMERQMQDESPPDDIPVKEMIVCTTTRPRTARR